MRTITCFSGVSYTAPSYLAMIGGTTIASLAKFVFDNSTYGGAGAALNATVKELIDKIRPPAGRRYGAEWFVAKLTRGATPVDPVVVGADTVDILFTNSFVPLPVKLTAGYYVRVISGKAAVMHATVDRSRIDDTEYAGGSAPTLLTPADGWKYVNLLTKPNAYGYQYGLFALSATNGAEVAFALPRIAFGHVGFDKDLGVLPNDRVFG